MSNRGLGFKYPGDDTRYNDAYVTWLLHMDGPVNSTYMLDHSPRQNGPASVGNAYVIGDGSSGPGPLHPAVTFFPNNAYVYSPVNVDNSFNLALNDFTIDWWEHRVGDVTTYRPSFTWDTVAQVYVPMLVGWGIDTGLYYYASNDQANWNMVSAMLMGTAQLNVWIHRAIVRKGTTFYAFENGVLKGTATSALAFNPATYGPMLGCWPNPGGYAYFYGYMQEFRVSNGIARWTANFIPPTRKYEPYPDLDTKLLMHYDGNLADSSQYKRGVAATAGSPVVANITPTPFGGGKSLYLNIGSFIGYVDSADWVIGTKDFTVDCWVYLSSYPSPNNYAVVTQMGANGESYNDRHLFLYIGSNGAVVSDAFAGGAQIYMTATAAGAVPFNTWTHIAVVRNGRPVQIYINGVLGSGFLLPVNQSFQDLDGPLRIGAMGAAATDQMFAGYIDEVRFVSGKALWTADFTPPAHPIPINLDKTVLLLHYDTNFQDSSQKRHGTGNSNAGITTAQKKFGSQSLMLSGAQYHYFPDSPDFDFGASDFTIDFWLYRTAEAPLGLFGQVLPDLTNFSIGSHTTGAGNFIYTSVAKTGSDWAANGIQGTTPVTANVWHHFALTRQGSTIRAFLDGIIDGPPLNFGIDPIFNSTAAFVIGAMGNYSLYWNGFFDEFRITKGKALWSANFTPPTQPGN